MKRSFTIVEILISVVIIGLIIGIIFRIYINVLDITTRVENEKILNTEMLFLSQNIQNISDKYKLDFEKYSQDELIAKHGITKALYFTGNDEQISIYATGDCQDDTKAIGTKQCRIQMDKNGTIVDITDKNRIYFTKFYFKILPYADIKKYTLNFEDIYQDGFWVFSESYINRYKSFMRPFDVKLNYQSFFNIRRYDF